MQLELKPLELLDKSDIVKHNLSKHGKELDESPFNNQVQYRRPSLVHLELFSSCCVTSGSDATGMQANLIILDLVTIVIETTLLALYL